MNLLMILTVAAVGAAPQPGSTIADQRNAMRDVCAKLRGSGPATAATRTAFKRCVGQIRYDGDLPPQATPRTR